jgi:DNA invertase Pin-like site-specific DNA recombinase
MLIVSELSRMGRSVGEIITTVDMLVKRKICFIALKENIRFNGSQDMQTKVMVAMFSLFAEIERDLISMWTKEGLATAKVSGKRLGRPKGALGKSKLDGREKDLISSAMPKFQKEVVKVRNLMIACLGLIVVIPIFTGSNCINFYH